MAYTPENNPYIPGDPYSYDLNWQVENIKHLQTRFTELDEQVQEATDQADRAQQEADRAAGRADFATDEADRATQQADNAAASAEAAADSEEAAKDYADHIADPVSGLVTSWLAENVDPDTGYVIDKTLTIPNAAADAEVVGKRFEDVAEIDNTAFLIQQNYLDADTLEAGYYYALNNAIRTGDDAAGNYQRFAPFSIKAGVYWMNETPNSFMLILHEGIATAITTLATQIVANEKYRVTIPYDGIVYMSSDIRHVHHTTNAMFTNINLPSSYGSGVIKTIYQVDNMFLGGEIAQNRHVLVVGKNQKYTTIQSACDAADPGDTIIVLPGEYQEQVSIWGKKLNIIGTDRYSCVLIDFYGNYDNPPLEMNVGSLKNMTVIQRGWYTDPDLPDSKYNTSYCLHIESGVNADGEEFLIENCTFINNVHAAIGCGLYKNYTVHFRDCFFESTDEKSRGIERAPFYYHSNTGQNIDGQKMIVENCLIHSATQYCVWAGKVGGSSGTTESVFIGNSMYSDINKNEIACVRENFDREFQLSELSTDNNVAILNNSVSANTREYSAAITGNGNITVPTLKSGVSSYGIYEYHLVSTDGEIYSCGNIEYFSDRAKVREISNLHCNVTIAANGNIYVFNRDANDKTVALFVKKF